MVSPGLPAAARDRPRQRPEARQRWPVWWRSRSAYRRSILLGPNAFLSLARENYRNNAPNLRDLTDTLTYPGFWKFAAENIPATLQQVRTAVSKKAFVEEARKFVPAIESADVVKGVRGIRAQALNADGSLVDDFVIRSTGRLVQVRNAPSPGATASLAIAEHIVEEALAQAG